MLFRSCESSAAAEPATRFPLCEAKDTGVACRPSTSESFDSGKLKTWLNVDRVFARTLFARQIFGFDRRRNIEWFATLPEQSTDVGFPMLEGGGREVLLHHSQQG